MQILAKGIMVDPHGEIVKHELNLPFVYLRPVVDHLFTPSNGEGWFGTDPRRGTNFKEPTNN